MVASRYSRATAYGLERKSLDIPVEVCNPDLDGIEVAMLAWDRIHDIPAFAAANERTVVGPGTAM